MITQDQILNLSKIYQIDNFSIKREYIQLVFLSYFYQEKSANKFYFKGGTALRLIFGSPRFSEDLDFSTTCSNLEIQNILSKVVAKIKLELPSFRILPMYSGQDGSRFRINYTDSRTKFPLNIRLDFHQEQKLGKPQISTLTTKFPVTIFPQVFHLTIDDILGEKILALETRNKGRDIFDIWYLLSKGVQGNFSKKAIKNLSNFSQKKLESDLAVFLPKVQKSVIPTLKSEIVRIANLKFASSNKSI